MSFIVIIRIIDCNRKLVYPFSSLFLFFQASWYHTNYWHEQSSPHDASMSGIVLVSASIRNQDNVIM